MQMQQPQLIIPPQPQPQQLYQQQTPVQQMNSIPAQQQLRMVNQMPMNLYQPFSNQSANISGCFNDDEELIQRVK